MSNSWKPKERKDLGNLQNAVSRHIGTVINSINAQNKEIQELIKKYKLEGTLNIDNSKRVYLEDYGVDFLVLKEFEYIDKTDDGKNLFNVMIVKVENDGTIKRLEMFTEENSAELNNLNDSSKGKTQIRISPYGGPSAIKISMLEGKLGYDYEFVCKEEDYQISQATIVDDKNYFLTYSKKDGENYIYCGMVKCINGKVRDSSFDRKDDFKAICNLYKPRGLSELPAKCAEHTRSFALSKQI